MIVAVIGCRDSGRLTVEQVIAELPENCTAIISGGAVGVDSLAREAAIRLELPFLAYQPEYDTYGRKAPLMRNTTIVDRADCVLAFWDYRSPGTRDTLRKARRQGKPVRIVRLPE